MRTRPAIAATVATAEAVANLRALSVVAGVSVILIAVILLPLAQAAWMPAT